jgi:hypothetical protein
VPSFTTKAAPISLTDQVGGKRWAGILVSGGALFFCSPGTFAMLVVVVVVVVVWAPHAGGGGGMGGGGRMGGGGGPGGAPSMKLTRQAFWIATAKRRTFCIRPTNGQALAYVYFEDEPGRRSAGRLITRAP